MRGPLRSGLPCRGSQIVCSALVLVSALFLAGCIATKSSNGGGVNQQTTVSVSPATATVSGGSTTTFTATVTGPSETAVTWSVNGVQNGNSALGTLTPGANSSGTTTAVYTAPATVPNPPTISITAAAVANGTTSTPSTVTITPSQVAVTVTPATANLNAGGQQQFTAKVTGASNTTVGWYVGGSLGGNSTVGTISTTGLYTAPSNLTQNATATITAQSQADTTKQGTATVNITGIAVTISPVPTSTIVPVPVPVSGTQEFSATVTGTSNTAVTNWQVTPVGSVNPPYGTIVSTGANTAVYTAPASVSAAPFTVAITAVSAANTASSGSILANVHVTVTVMPATDTIGQGANLLYTATVTGGPSGSQGVNWISSGGGGFVPVADTTGVPSNEGIYIAPPLSQGQSTQVATVTATSQFDSTQSGTATITVQETDPLGAVSGFQQYSGTCPTATEDSGNTSCYQMSVACDQVAPWTTYLKVNTPTQNPPLGTVIFATDGGGANLYDLEYTYGDTTVGDVVTDGYTAVQVSFGAPFDSGASPNGWLTGPGGVRRLACRFATVANWIYNNPTMLNSNTTTTAPLCGTGNGGGAGAIAYAVSEYGLNGANTLNGVNPNLKMIELTNGPVMTALDQGCICSTGANGPSGAPCNAAPAAMCYTQGATTIDAAYSQPTVCSGGNTINTLLLTSDSIYYQRGKGAVFPLPNTTVNQLFGSLDTGGDEPQGWQWNKVVLQTFPTASCRAGGMQGLPNDSLSAAQIATDIANLCK